MINFLCLFLPSFSKLSCFNPSLLCILSLYIFLGFSIYILVGILYSYGIWNQVLPLVFSIFSFFCSLLPLVLSIENQSSVGFLRHRKKNAKNTCRRGTLYVIFNFVAYQLSILCFTFASQLTFCRLVITFKQHSQLSS